MSRSPSQHSVFVMTGSRVQTSFLSLRNLPQYLEPNAWILAQIRPRPLPSASFPILRPLNVRSFDAVEFEFRVASLNGPLHTYTHTYIYTHIHTLHTHKHTHTYIHINIYTHTYIHYIHTNIHIYIHTLHTHIHTYIHYIHYIHIYIHTHKHTHIHTLHTHIHTQQCDQSRCSVCRVSWLQAINSCLHLTQATLISNKAHVPHSCLLPVDGTRSVCLHNSTPVTALSVQFATQTARLDCCPYVSGTNNYCS
jgi:hypothetical protein